MQRFPQHIPTLFILAACLSLLAVTGHAEPQERVSSACELVSVQQAGQIFGEPLDLAEELQHRENGDIFVSLCAYTSSDPDSMASTSVLVRYDPAQGDSQAAAEAHVAAFREGIGDPAYPFEPVANVGEAALLDTAMKQLIVFDQGRMIVIQGFGSDVEQKLVDMALAVLAH